MEEVNHHIEKHILNVLAYNQVARFSAMRPPKVDSNLYAYHLNRLIRLHYILKTEGGYTLSAKGLEAVDSLYVNQKNAWMTKIVTGILVKNEKNEILLTKCDRQPFINQWGLGLGRIYIDEHSTLQSAVRNLYDKTGVQLSDPVYRGDSYIRIILNGYYLSNVLAHLFYKQVQESLVEPGENSKWFGLDEVSRIDTVPSVPELVNLITSNQAIFYENLIIRDDVIVYRRSP
jgi:hypothetical protein